MRAAGNFYQKQSSAAASPETSPLSEATYKPGSCSNDLASLRVGIFEFYP